MALRKGDVVVGRRGRYTIDSLIGQGGLGRVWKARANDGSVVAVKEPLMGIGQDQVTIEKLRIEALVLEKLTGEQPLILSRPEEAYDLDPLIKLHIVRFRDVGRDPQGVLRYLVLEFVEGTSMDKKLRSGSNQGGLIPDSVDKYTIEILNITKALHQNNILHRDISPHNLISATEPRRDPLLLDFGTVKEGFNQLSAQVLSSQIIKAGYSAPELALGLASPSSDLYSVGATMLFLYTSVNPQYLFNSRGEIDKHNKDVRRIPDGRLEILTKALSYHPADRYQTAEDMRTVIMGKSSVEKKPHVVASGRQYDLEGPMIVGRNHKCGQECLRRGFSGAPDIPINDPKQFISRHHAKVQIGPNGVCWIEDLHAPSRTAIRKASGYQFEILTPGRGYRLQDGDIVALAYSPTKGPYLTVSYHTK